MFQTNTGLQNSNFLKITELIERRRELRKFKLDFGNNYFRIFYKFKVECWDIDDTGFLPVLEAL